MDLLSLAQSSIPDLKKKTAKEWAGPCPACGGSDRFLVWTHKDAWYCRGCNESGDAVAFLRKFEGKSCPEAHAALGKDCDSSSCPVADKCSRGRGEGPRPKRSPRHLQAPAPAAVTSDFAPAEAILPADRWRQSAEKLIDRAHEALLACPEQLDYLDRRGLPRDAVERYRLGWLAEDLYRPRATWGLPEEISPRTLKPKKLWLPMGIVIPFFGTDGAPFRIRIRRPKIQEGECRYYWVPGSGDDVPVIGHAARAFVIVESDLDGYLIAWHAGDLAGAIPLGTCSAKPKETAMAALKTALAILVSLDHEPRENEKTGRHENPGGKSALWWLQQFPRARRWPTPAGKDPGEYYQDHGGDIRQWILSGLPPVFHVKPAPSVTAQVETQEAPAPAVEQPAPAPAAEPDHGLRGYVRGVSGSGIDYIVAETADILARAREFFPDHAPFLREELQYLKGMEQQQIDAVLADRAKVFNAFGDCRVLGCRPIIGDGRVRNVLRFDPSRQRNAQGRR